MSMPNIPDITPEMDITFQDSINLLLASIAMEENSLSKLLDAETKKVLFIINECENDEASAQDALNINNSINKTIINMIKMQMLLQFKLENVERIISTSSTSSTTPTCSTTAKCHKCGFCLIEKSKGMVSNKPDKFYGKDVTLKAIVSSCNCKDNTIRYKVGDDCNSLYMKADAYDIKIECPSVQYPYEKRVWGKGLLIRTEKGEETFLQVNFELLVCCNKEGKKGFQMIIESSEDPAVAHNSGFVKVCCYNTGYDIKTY